jgi:hypothetical protein
LPTVALTAWAASLANGLLKVGEAERVGTLRLVLGAGRPHITGEGACRDPFVLSLECDTATAVSLRDPVA